ncbi:MAG: lamin tail domain-containing protein [Microgenomates group bacterium]|nr:lamin tail domain-containing protein [Microgenomates group bacterium]
MIKKIIIFFCLFFSCFLASHHCLAEQTILINELVIEPTQSVELFNKGDSTVDISNWYLDDSGGSSYYTIAPGAFIYPNGCLAFTANFYLNSASADSLRLFDRTAPPTSSSAVLIDSYSYNKSPGSEMAFFRLPDGGETWQVGNKNLGKYNTNNDLSCIILPTLAFSPTPIITPFPSPTLTIFPTPTVAPPSPTITSEPLSYDNIFISEIMAYPDKEENEWIELYNNNNETVYLSNWFIDDVENGGSSPKKFSLTIEAKNFQAIELSSSMFNNDGDSVRLLDFNKNLKDSLDYPKAEKGKTFVRNDYDSDNICQQEPTKNMINYPCLSLIPSSSSVNINTWQSPTTTPWPSLPISKNKKEEVKKEKIIDYFTFDTNHYLPQEGQVLGINNEKIIFLKNQSLINCLSFVSFFYALLTILSLCFKMKN